MEEKTKKPSNEEGQLSKIKNRKQYFETKYSRQLACADKENAYFRSEQWTQAELDLMKDEEGNLTKPALTLNHIKAHINFLRGEQAENRYYFKVIPADNIDPQEQVTYDGQPIPIEKLSTRLTEELKKAESDNDGEYEISDCFLEGISGGGRSYLEVMVDVDKSSFPYKTRALFQHVGQKNFFPDPDHKKYDLTDCKDGIKISEYTKDDLIKMFPDKKDVIKELTRDEETLYKGDVNDDNELNYTDNTREGIIQGLDSDIEDDGDSLILVEYYDSLWAKSYMLVTSTGEQPMPVSEENYAKVKELNDKRVEMSMAEITMNPLDEMGQPRESFEYKLFDIEKKEWFISSYVSGMILHRERLEVNGVPISRLPFSEYGADVAKYIEELSQRYISATKDMISPQDLYNKSKSSTLDHLLKSVHSGIVAEEDTLVDVDHWEECGSEAGFVGLVKRGKFDKWAKMEPTALSSGHVFLAQDAAQEMRYITNINLQMRGQNEGGESGKAKQVQVHQGEKGIKFYFDNLRRTKHILAKILLEYICALKGLDFKKLKVEIDDTLESPTARYANWMETKQMFESGILESPYGDLVIDKMNFNNREEWKGRFEQVNEFKQYQAQMQQKAEAEKLGAEDAMKELKRRGAIA